MRTLTRAERDAYWQDYRVIGRLFGLRDGDMPADIDAFDAYMRGMLDGDDLYVTPAARELAIQIVHAPAGPARAPAAARARRTQITVGLLPARRCARSTGCAGTRLRALALRGGAEYAKRVLVPLLPDRVRLTPRARAA